MSELRYGTITAKAYNIDWTPVANVFKGWNVLKFSYRSRLNYWADGQGKAIIEGCGFAEPNILKINNSPFSLFSAQSSFSLIYECNDNVIKGTDTNKSQTNISSNTQKYYIRYAINDETGDWILSICETEDYSANRRQYLNYCTIIHTTLDDGQKVIFGPDGTMTYYNDDGTWSNSDYKALYNNIGANYSSMITRNTVLIDFCAVNVKTGELITIPRFKYSVLYNGDYEPTKFEDTAVGDAYVLVPGCTKNSVAVCLKEVQLYDVD